MKEYTPEEVVEELKIMMNEQKDQEVAHQLGLQKQNISQFKQGKQFDVKMRIISYLLQQRKKK
jgi:DNA-binding Xre family transcriptional regulator